MLAGHNLEPMNSDELDDLKALSNSFYFAASDPYCKLQKTVYGEAEWLIGN